MITNMFLLLTAAGVALSYSGSGTPAALRGAAPAAGNKACDTAGWANSILERSTISYQAIDVSESAVPGRCYRTGGNADKQRQAYSSDTDFDVSEQKGEVMTSDYDDIRDIGDPIEPK